MVSTPMKCGPSVTKTSFLLHTLGFAWYTFGIYHDQLYYNFETYKEFGGRFKFLTNITCYLIWVASGIAMMTDMLQLCTRSLEPNHSLKEETSSFLIKFRDELMSFWTFTLGSFVPFMFWGIAAVDLDGMYPKDIREMSPLMGWFNHFVHTTPLFYALLLTVLVNYEHAPIKRVFMNILLLGSAYITWMYYCSKQNGAWAYDFMNKLTTNQFIIFIIFAHLVFLFFYMIGRKMSAFIWTKERREKYLKNKNV